MKLLRSTLLTQLSLAGAFLLLPACGKVVPLDATGDGGATVDSGSPGDDGDVKAPCDAPVDFEDLNGCLMEAQCKQFTRCNPLFADMEECLEFLPTISGDFEQQFAKFAAAIDAGKANYDGVAAKDCLDSFAEGSCNSDGSDEACEGVFRGETPANGSCFESFECATLGSRCEEEQCPGQCCMGTCVSPAPTGQSCDFVGCQPGDHCVNATETGGPGSPTCHPGNQGSPCEGSFDCDSDHFCDNVQKQCAPQRPLNAPCGQSGFSDNECAGDAQCVTGICQEVNEVGDVCEGFCLGGLICQNGICAEAPGVGESCTETGICNSFLLDCVGNDGVALCSAKRELGETCSQRACVPGLLCESELPAPPNTPRCIELLSDNMPCERDSHCQSRNCDFSGGIGRCAQPENCYQ